MSKTSTASKEKYNAKSYERYTFRVRKNSDLNNEITNFMKLKGSSLNYLVTKLLCEHFGVAVPNPETDSQNTEI
jgi:predicted HicB family RNase H-like nuclease